MRKRINIPNNGKSTYNKSIEDICCQNAESNIHYEKRIKELEIRLNEAQQWIDSEPDWKDKYMANYQQLQKEKEQETKIVTLYRSILSGCSVHGLWEGVSCIGCIEQERDILRQQLAEAQAALDAIASRDEGPKVDSSFDEPGSAQIAREALTKAKEIGL